MNLSKLSLQERLLKILEDCFPKNYVGLSRKQNDLLLHLFHLKTLPIFGLYLYWSVIGIHVILILAAVSAVILGICFCCIRRCFRKRRAKDGKKGMKGVDLKSVQLLGSSYKEKVTTSF